MKEILQLEVENIIYNENVNPYLANYKRFTKNLHEVPPWTVWDFEEKRTLPKKYIPQFLSIDHKTFLESCEKYFSNFTGKRIGVHLSGGFDSGLVIGILKELNIPFYLAGIKSKRFEFRTERFIQEIMSFWGNDVRWVDYDTCLPFSCLHDAPCLQSPSTVVVNYYSSLLLACEFEKMDVDIVFHGFGGDYVFTDSVPKEPSHCRWIPELFQANYLNEKIYKPRGIELVSFYGSEQILNMIYSLRRGQENDFRKKWSRVFFRNYLPFELASFFYVGDYFGYFIDGIVDNMNDIKLLFEECNDITNNVYFNKNAFEIFKKQDYLSKNKNLFTTSESLVSIATWVRANKNAKLV